MTEQELAKSSGGVGPSWPRAKSTPSAVDTAVAMPADEARPPGIEKQSATTESDIAVSSDEARPPGIERHSATTESDIEVSSGEAGLLGPQQMAGTVPASQQSHCLLVKLGLLESQSRVLRRNRNSQRVLVVLGLLGPEQMA